MPLILPNTGIFELEEKRSRFIGNCGPVSTREEALDFIKKHSHKDANHNVFAYATRKGNITRMSDDGEPTGTAGMPVLNVFQKTGIVDYVCVVTRYFGGTLLGAGGLVRAYSKAAKGAMEAAKPTEEIISAIYQVICHYNQFDNVKYHFDKWGIEILNTEYTDCCTLTVNVTEAQEPDFLKGTFYTICTNLRPWAPPKPATF